jgi:hypothetical protein
MRNFHRPIVPCSSCGAKIYWEFSPPENYDDDTVSSPGWRPPDERAKCRRCGAEVNTTVAFASIPGFPPSIESLKKAYAGFVPIWEYNRESFEAAVHDFVKKGMALPDLERGLNEDGGIDWYRQRMFYRSCTAFYRSFQLLLAYLVLDRKCFRTWASVTGYYSRFFFIQAFLNLILATWDSLHKCFFFFDGAKVRCVEHKNLPPTIKREGSHEVWWQFMEAIKIPPDYPLENGEFVLSRLLFNPTARNNANYGFEYLAGGFPELDWFDSGAKQMMSHFMPYGRADRDITNIDRFFEGRDPENCDPADFYADEGQILWCSLKTYLDMLKALSIDQKFILTENLAALAEVHLRNDYPRLMRGILLSTEETLGNGFNVDAFMRDREDNPDRRSSFLP